MNEDGATPPESAAHALFDSAPPRQVRKDPTQPIGRQLRRATQTLKSRRMSGSERRSSFLGCCVVVSVTVNPVRCLEKQSVDRLALGFTLS
jgi:hypothetical protein